MTPVAIRTLANVLAIGGLFSGLTLGLRTFRHLAWRSEAGRGATGRFRLGMGGERE